ncbi:MAG TPA: methionine ABC transporter ATP-binding protein [Spirochaetia bacterium]|nr:MAG: hypothetical protein A2Y41_02805 [Spirochaetes bacterium GWB1_36_13]HCL57781.1 methionine ABC transporter ATP-binding protein [Spirochaetia bacterium]
MILSAEHIFYRDILQNISFQVKEKEKIGIAGLSGSGKTTLLKLLNTLILPDSGNLFFKQKPFSHYTPLDLRKKISLFFQNSTLFGKTIKENLLFPFAIQKNLLFPDQKRLEKVLEITSLSYPLDNLVYSFSGGEKQRLLLARTLLLDPDVFLFDEPTSALDIKTAQIVFQRIFEEFQDKTFLIVSHSLPLLEKTDRVFFMEKNKSLHEIAKNDLKNLKEIFNEGHN